MSSAVQHLPGQNRYILEKDGEQVGLTDYSLHGNEIHLTHTEIDPQLRDEGLASEMVQGVLDSIRTDTAYRVVAECPYVVKWLGEHPEYHELEQRG
ncbi:GNAT family N-acetyltransferase [Glaciihabitans sp. UYNi722]|uniref:GNAT family N-acetyltransferase n=1 Tax=Glaciihabitans sp. UYNi722 TaxID=3156344 RepID=UPI0033988743